MKSPGSTNRRLSLLILWALLFLAFPVAAQEEDLLKHPREMNFPPLSFVPPEAERVVLPNGLTVYFMEDPEIPLVHLSLWLRAGSIYDPRDRSGLAEVAAKAWREGGTHDQSPQSINEILESMAALLEISIGRESVSLTLSTQTPDFRRALAILADLILKPAFDPAQLDLIKKKEIEAIRRSNDNPEEIAYREFRKILYAGTPFGHVPSIESVSAIQREEVQSWHRRFFKPNNALMGISGDFRKEEMKKLIRETFRTWERSIVELPYVGVPTPKDRKLIYLVEKDLPQSTILMGHLAPPLHHPDHIPFKILDYIVGGGGFNSRLTREIRSNQGLAYSVGSFYRGRVGFGVFGAYCQTQSSTTARVIRLFEEILGGIKKDKIQESELEWAKKAIVNRYIFTFSSSAQIVQQQMEQEFDLLPPDFFRTYPERVKAVTLADLHRVADEHLHPEKALLLVIGKENDFDQPLSIFGPVHRIELQRYD